MNASLLSLQTDCVACEKLSDCLTGVSETHHVPVSPTGVHGPGRSGRRRGEDGASSEAGRPTRSSGAAGESGSRRCPASWIFVFSVFMVHNPNAHVNRKHVKAKT